MFKITKGRGFHITFKNGYTISVQFGFHNYCEHYDKWPMDIEDYERTNEELQKIGSYTAEIAILNPNKKLIKVKGWAEKVKGYCTPEEVLKWINYTEQLKGKK